jgi:hypothetical protein
MPVFETLNLVEISRTGVEGERVREQESERASRNRITDNGRFGRSVHLGRTHIYFRALASRHRK